MPSTSFAGMCQCAIACASLTLAASARSQAVLFDNGPFITNPGEGFGGADVSRTQAGAGNFIGVANTALRDPPAVLADGFDVTGGSWDLSTLTWYAFQTQTANFTTVNPFDIVYVRIFDGPPSTGANVIAGDQVTNRFVSGAWSGAYRTSSSAAAAQNQQRPIMSLTVDMSWAPVLSPGSYYLAVSVGNSALPSTTVFGFPVTPRDNGTDTSEQFFDGTWFPGTLDFPFILRGDIVVACRADFNADGNLDPDDLADFVTCFFLDVQSPGTCTAADFNADGFRDPDDLADFITAFFTGC